MQSVYVGYPNIAQSDINDTSAAVDGVSLSDPTQNTIRIGVNSTLRPKTSYHPNLHSFNATFRLENSTLGPFTTVEFPSVHVQKPLAVNVSNQEVALSNMDAFDEYVRVAVASESYNIIVEGKPKLKLGALPTTSVTFNKTIPVPGLQGFKGVSTSNITINITSMTNNFHSLTNIPNPSTSILNIGNLTYNTYAAPNDTFVGPTVINNVVLHPGDNILPTVASIQQQPIIAALGVRPSCENGLVNVTLVPANVTNNGIFLPYLLQGLTNVTQTLPLGDAISAATNGFAHYYCPPGV